MKKLLTVGEQAIEGASKVLLDYFGTNLALEAKSAASPIVTQADRVAEAEMRRIITRAFPDHNILGEEFGSEDMGSPYTWVLDPLDGTIAFAMGKPLFTTLLAVWEKNTPLLGIIAQPLLKQQWISVRGKPTTLSNKDVEVSGVTSLAEARLSTTDPYLFSRDQDRAWFKALSSEASITSYGGDAYSYGLLASGSIDLIIESGLSWHDIAALIPVIEGAGGLVQDFDGNPLKPGEKFFDVIAASSKELLRVALSLKT